MTKNKPWFYNSAPLTEIPPKAIGFVYIIHNTQTNKFYIGKKLFKHKRNKKLIESDWKSYTGSNKTLNEEIKTLNPTLVKTIIHLCYSKSECNYLEAAEQFNNNVILSDQYYNDWISVKVTKKQLMKYIANLNKSENNS